MDIQLEVPAPFPIPEEVDWDTPEWIELRRKLMHFWGSLSTLEWFEARGYTLYKRLPDSIYTGEPSEYSVPTKPSLPCVEGEYPYAYHDNYLAFETPDTERLAEDMSASVVFAQNAQGHHVAIKLVAEGSDEHRINELVKQESANFSEEDDGPGILPVLEILHTKGYCFVVMPSGSVIIPKGSRIGEFRLPYAMSQWGRYGCLPNDTAQGEYDYDPFAYDVGMMGPPV
ncbi:hypothetical protein EST38_g12478 [Candolleomyces aberdarensis]|uniref:Uncharacterized protein n=1 Tax=Candolleomyces aberdarensis TaxID=2316362 RepID=A0A4Q2D2C3_9AGAR|nr:hypothetical protein EST38_g12478 [Candolleomyces aberdarensis]